MLRPALLCGATELHVHLLARSRWERLDIETDLRNGHWTPLNEQPTRAPEPVNALAGLGGFGTGGLGGLVNALSSYRVPAAAPTAGFGGIAPFGALDTSNPFLEALEPRNSLGALARAPGASR